MTIHILAIDGGKASTGVAVLELTRDAPAGRVLLVEVIRTKKSARKRNIRVADDDSDRARQVFRRLLELARAHRPAVIGVEAVALPFGRVRSSVVSGLGRARGLVDALAVVADCGLVEPTPQEVKKVICGRRDASKDDVLEAAKRRFPELAELLPPQKTLLEHAADAVAVGVVALGSDLVRTALAADRARNGEDIPF